MTMSGYKHRECVVVCVMLDAGVLISHACTVLFILYNATITCITLHLLSFLVKQHKPFVLYSHAILVKKKKVSKVLFCKVCLQNKICFVPSRSGTVLACTAPVK